MDLDSYRAACHSYRGIFRDQNEALEFTPLRVHPLLQHPGQMGNNPLPIPSKLATNPRSKNEARWLFRLAGFLFMV